MRQIHDTEFPNSVEATEQLLIGQETQYIRLKVKLELIGCVLDRIISQLCLFQDEISSAGCQGEELLAEIRKKTELCVDRIGNISSIER